MEVAGLAIGVVGLAGLIGTFSDVIQLFELFSAARSLEKDTVFLTTKLDIERSRLLQWAHDVRLLRPDYDKRLDDVNTQHLVSRVLKCIQSLMTDAGKLKEKYGVRDAGTQESASTELVPLHMSQSGTSSLTLFLTELGVYQPRIKEEYTNKIGFRKRVRWAVHDKELFGKLVQELNYFTGSLETILGSADNLLPSRPLPDHQGLAEYNVLTTQGLVPRTDKWHHLEQTEMDAMSESDQKKRILDTLWSRRQDERKDRITPAHSDTLKWAFGGHDQTVVWDDLSSWLLSGSGIYWICGKAGSGKSTLIRHICESERTTSLLFRWNRGQKCPKASFYFWHLGNQEQNTLIGLGR